MPYCTPDDVESDLSESRVTEAIAEAQERVDAYTGHHFEPVEQTVVVEIGSNGMAWLPSPASSLESVTYEGSETVLSDTVYRTSLTSTGLIAALETRQWGYDDLIAGAESYSGGWANLFRSGRRLTLTGTFGPETVPLVVKRATAKLAQAILEGSVDGVPAGIRSASVDSVSVTYADSSDSSSTGLGEVDRMLAGLRRTVQVG